MARRASSAPRVWQDPSASPGQSEVNSSNGVWPDSGSYDGWEVPFGRVVVSCPLGPALLSIALSCPPPLSIGGSFCKPERVHASTDLARFVPACCWREMQFRCSKSSAGPGTHNRTASWRRAISQGQWQGLRKAAGYHHRGGGAAEPQEHGRSRGGPGLAQSARAGFGAAGVQPCGLVWMSGVASVQVSLQGVRMLGWRVCVCVGGGS